MTTPINNSTPMKAPPAMLNGIFVDKSQKSNETLISIPKAELEGWLSRIESGLVPTVSYNMDSSVMLGDAYKVRGDMLYYLNHRIRTFVWLDEQHREMPK